MGDLSGRSILVVGASSGMGRASAIAMTRAGADVVYAARRTEPLEEAIAEAGGGHVMRIDVSDPVSIADGVKAAIDRLNGLDGILYTAGMSPLSSLRDLDAGQWQQIFAVNTFGPSLVISAALDRLNPDGVVAVVSSDSASQPRHSLVAYAASKAALEASMDGWRTEQLGGLRFLTILLGPTAPTAFGDQFPPDVMTEVFGHWSRQGLKTGLLSADDVGAHLAETFDLLLSRPGYGVESLLLRAPEPETPVDLELELLEELSAAEPAD